MTISLKAAPSGTFGEVLVNGSPALKVSNGLLELPDGKDFFNQGNIVGTVSQSGGIPTGAVVERGSNANGEYVRFADGTQICFAPGHGNLVSSGTAWKTSLYALTFAAAFSGIPVITFSLARDSTNYSSIAMLVNDGTSPTSTGFKVGGPLGVTDTGTSIWILYTAIGRWY